MDKDKKQLSPDELEQFGGGMNGGRGIRSNTQDDIGQKIAKWEQEVAGSTIEAAGKNALHLGKMAFKWFTGLFSRND